MQQHLPFTVLKRNTVLLVILLFVATAPTVYGIETCIHSCHSISTVYVATAPTIYGIETNTQMSEPINVFHALQQHLPFTVLKLSNPMVLLMKSIIVATAPTVYGIETHSRKHNEHPTTD